MKRLSYITMIFLPASFVAVRSAFIKSGQVFTIALQNAFGMNVVELNPVGYTSLAHFFEASLPLTFFTIWIVIAFQSRFVLRDDRGSMWKKLLWPIVLFNSIISRSKAENEGPDYDIPLQSR